MSYIEATDTNQQIKAFLLMLNFEGYEIKLKLLHRN